MKWKHKFDVSEPWAAAKTLSDEGIPTLAREIARRLTADAALYALYTDEVEMWESLFNDLAENAASVEDFDALWERFYDWADRRRVWVVTR